MAEPHLGLGEGIHTPALYLQWRAGLSPAHARDIARLAGRIHELPNTVASLCEGSISLDQATVVARYVPASHEAGACELAKALSVPQLRRTFRRYAFDADVDPDAPRPEPERSVSTGTDERGWWGNLRLTEDEGAVFDQSLRSMVDDLRKQAKDDAADGDDPIDITMADAAVAVAEAGLRAGEARFPGSDRYLVHLHLEGTEGEGVDPLTLSVHLGGPRSRTTRRLLLCDARLASVLHCGGVVVNAGRATREISRSVKRIVEHRDGGCTTPGCGARRNLQVHHIVHWEDGGPTDTANLLTLCRKHHRAHHLGLLEIAGNADLPAGSIGAVTFADRWGRPMAAVGDPLPPGPATTAAAEPAAPYRGPAGERVNWLDFFIQQGPGPHPPVAAVPPPAEPAAVGGVKAGPEHVDAGAYGSLGSHADTGPAPTRAGPVAMP